jgi:uroporphyrinogen-III synthase
MEKLINHGILLTQTRPPTDQEISFWNQRGYTVHIQALLNVQFLTVETLNLRPQAIILTSANGAVALEHSNWDRTIPVYGVGAATAAAAKEVGFLNCLSPSNKPYPSALNLVNWIKKTLKPENGVIVFGCGEHIRHDVAQALNQSGFTTLKIILYKTQHIAAFYETVELALKNNCIDSVVINSEQALKTFASLCHQARIPVKNLNIQVPSKFLKTAATQLGYLDISILPQN